MIENDWVWERVLDRALCFSLHGLRHRLPETEMPYWLEHVGKRITIDDEYKTGILLIEPRRTINLSNLYAVAVVRGGYAWLQNVSERVDRAEQKFCERYCEANGWDRNALNIEQAMEITSQEGYRRAGGILRKKKPR